MENAVIVVDPISTGRVLAKKVIDLGYTTIALWSMGSQQVEGIGECNIEFACEVYEIEGDIEGTIGQILNLPFKIVASLVGCECGVELNDLISEKLCLKTNGSLFAEARRDKWAMQERIRECGLRAIKQTAAASMQDVEDFIQNEGLSKWVMKPRRDAGTNGVFMCETLEEARAAYENITNRCTIFGERNETVLVQEFLVGKEYVVDTVSCAGEHKAVAIWEYDKIHMHGSAFVYLDDHLYESEDGSKEEGLASYVFKVLTALGVQNGPTHAEVMWLTEDECPCLVEIGCRPHGAGGNFPDLCDPVIGYNQLDVTINAYLYPEKFEEIPHRPGKLHGMGVQYKIICYKDGVLEGMDFSELKKLECYSGIDMHRSIGDKVQKTVDLITCPGIIRLVHSDAAVVEREKLLLRTFEENMFTIRPHQVVIVIDPISTGRVLAKKILDKGYEVVVFWTKAAQSVEGIGDCEGLEFLFEFNEIEGDLDATLDQLKVISHPVVASLVGCESGVELNDAISSKLGLASNGTSKSEARRDKYAMQEAVRASGLRAIKQKVATSFSEVMAFVTKENLRDWILKPRRSAGSQGVHKCSNAEEARRAFDEITNQETIFGESNPDVLVQEFLVGKEYVVDTVSSNGEHKAVAIWEYDKIFMHGSAFVYLDDHLYQTEDGVKEKQLTEYVFKVLEALQVKYGPCHAEAMWLAEENRPCLIEIGTRPHGAGGNFPILCDPVYGYNQLDVTIDAYLYPQKFAQIPTIPLSMKGLGVQYKMICYEEGILESVDFEELEKMQSFVGIDMHRHVGEHVVKTIDLVTSPAIVRLVHSDASVVNRDKALLRELERNMLKIKPIPAAQSDIVTDIVYKEMDAHKSKMEVEATTVP
mmetsp:Transcript_15304/g.20191  ORF Transcript_15304/g.20191 Transcript_15304/m.20191 type:complete len:873 (+) Transcript_15304:272-2890(+)